MIVCEKWKLPELPQTENGAWFADWAARRPWDVSAHLTAGYHALHSLWNLQAHPRMVWEPFGGIGAQALMVEELWPRSTHFVNDVSQDAVDFIKRVVPSRPGFSAFQADSYAPESFIPADVIVADFGDLTVLRMEQPGKYHDLVERMFSGNAEAIVLTDIAGPRLHLVSGSYRPIVGDFKNYQGYLRGLGIYVVEKYFRFHPWITFYHKWSSVTVFRSTPPPGRHIIRPIPSSPIGFQK
jgi:hypothetical protein